MDFSTKELLTFDCYGTLIDWESGILAALRPVLAAHGVSLEDEPLLELFAEIESDLEAGPYRPYREVLSTSLSRIASQLSFTPSRAEVEAFSRSVKAWPAFSDSVEALRVLKRRFKLAVITNVDDDLFAYSSARLGVDFDWVITAQQAQSYKPSLTGFNLAFERIPIPRERWLHVAQSLYHDHVPAKELGLKTIWINRRHDKHGFGATPPAQAAPDLVVPDLAKLAELATT
ncbi:MAG: haloacid dehalogenase type II [Vulcanimicrobiaceae bacterium]